MLFSSEKFSEWCIFDIIMKYFISEAIMKNTNFACSEKTNENAIKR